MMYYDSVLKKCYKATFFTEKGTILADCILDHRPEEDEVAELMNRIPDAMTVATSETYVIDKEDNDDLLLPKDDFITFWNFAVSVVGAYIDICNAFGYYACHVEKEDPVVAGVLQLFYEKLTKLYDGKDSISLEDIYQCIDTLLDQCETHISESTTPAKRCSFEDMHFVMLILGDCFYSLLDEEYDEEDEED
ncbi:MAG: hypothetical protein K6A23_12590 [Butyrivibrio sp.]|nr:hypothetical protein [Butyrivibrio sp.]